MGYQVTYQQVNKRHRKKKRSSQAAVFTALFFLLFLLLTGSLWPQGAAVLRAAVIPGNPAVTAAALDDFTLELKSGAPLSSALFSFCDRVYQGADIDLG